MPPKFTSSTGNVLKMRSCWVLPPPATPPPPYPPALGLKKGRKTASPAPQPRTPGSRAAQTRGGWAQRPRPSLELETCAIAAPVCGDTVVQKPVFSVVQQVLTAAKVWPTSSTSKARNPSTPPAPCNSPDNKQVLRRDAEKGTRPLPGGRARPPAAACARHRIPARKKGSLRQEPALPATAGRSQPRPKQLCLPRPVPIYADATRQSSPTAAQTLPEVFGGAARSPPSRPGAPPDLPTPSAPRPPPAPPRPAPPFPGPGSPAAGARGPSRARARAPEALLRVAMPAARCGRARSLPRRSVGRRGRPPAPGIASPRLAGSLGAGWGRRAALPPREPGGRRTRWAANGRPRRGWAGPGAEMGGASAHRRGPPRLRMLCGAWEAAPPGTLGSSTWADPAICLALDSESPWSGKQRNSVGGMTRGRDPCVFPLPREGTEGFPSLAGLQAAGGSRPWEREPGSRCNSRPRASSTRLGNFYDLYFPLGQQNRVMLT